MEAQLEKFRDVQKDAWNKSAAGWKKWDEMTMNFMRPAGDEMISMLQLRGDENVLDVATGTGEPGLTIASKLKNGKVTGVDLAEQMLSVARDNAMKRGIKNFDTVCCDVSDLPFEDNTFDAISCRYGFMMFPDMKMALSEMVRVLKPGGRIVTAVWNTPEKNFWVANSMETMITRLNLNRPVQGAPGIFRCCQKGLMADLFRETGLKNIEEKEVQGKLSCETLATYWSFITETASPVAFFKADESLKEEIKKEIIEKVNQKCEDGNIALESSSFVISGIK
jgi:ubiquinone/menaquinone biosynthesis C-methylase UbiE